MRIHSDFHDYYDIALQYGRDESVSYNRKTIEIPNYDIKTADYSFGFHFSKQCLFLLQTGEKTPDFLK